MSEKLPTYKIEVEATSDYRDDLSNPMAGEFVFHYHITIKNTGDIAAQLLRRRWVITNGDGEQHIVEGDGVIGEHPLLPAGSSFSYSSEARLSTPVGIMSGHYTFVAKDQHEFMAEIPLFRLAVPNIIQ